MAKEKKPNLVFLMATKLKAHGFDSLKIQLGFQCVFIIECVGRSDGLALLWNEDYGVEIQNSSRSHINGVIKNEGLD